MLFVITCKNTLKTPSNTIMTETTPDAKPVFTCGSCKGPTRLTRGADKKNVFSICDECNPDGTIEEMIEGCETLCQVCFETVAYDNDQYMPCSECGKFMCEVCTFNRTFNVDRYHCCQQCYELWYARQ